MKKILNLNIIIINNYESMITKQNKEKENLINIYECKMKEKEDTIFKYEHKLKELIKENSKIIKEKDDIIKN